VVSNSIQKGEEHAGPYSGLVIINFLFSRLHANKINDFKVESDHYGLTFNANLSSFKNTVDNYFRGA